MDSVIVLPDIHVPDHDKRSLAPVLKYIQDTGPHKAIIQIGDFVDLSCISKHSKDSLVAQTERTVYDEYAAGQRVLRDINSVAGDAEKIMLEGNHEYRATKWIEKYPQMTGAIEPQLGLGLEELGWKWVPYWSLGTPYRYKKAMFVHGRWTNKYHAEKHVREYAHNIFYGHSHDVQEFSQSRYGDNDTIVGASLGCLCRYDMPYMQGSPSKWQQAFGHFMFKPSGFFNYYITRIFNHRFVGPNGKEY